MKIGIFDSGLGGLSVLHEAMKMNPDCEYIYYADEKNVPYGEKTKDEVRRFTDEAAAFMIGRGAEAIVIACNTATSCAIKYLREKYGIPFVGMEPAVKPAVEAVSGSGKRVLVTATPLTIREEKLRMLYERYDASHICDSLPLPMLVRFAEEGKFDTPEVEEYLRGEFSRFDLEKYHAVVLGCTHFGYFKDTMMKLLPEGIIFADGCEGTVRHLIGLMKERGIFVPCEPSVEYFFSGEELDETESSLVGRMMEKLDMSGN